uniref:Putative cytochrome P450 n=1 Tax=Puccinia horiana TaxID=331382 RepID=W8FLK3_9BASI|nr:putative cytochrome P450 [Puccinia horiana]
MLGPAGSWFGKLTGLGTHIVVLADGQQLVEPPNVDLCLHSSEDSAERQAEKTNVPVLFLRLLNFPSSVHHILVCSLSYKGIIPNGQLALTTGPVFKHHRRAIAHSMSSSHLSQVTPKITNSVIELIQLWKKRSQILDESGEKYFKAAQDLRLSTMDTISDIIFGKPFGVMSGRLSHLENSNGALSADSRPQFPKLARALNVIVREVAGCYVSPSKPLFWLYQRVFNGEWRRAKSTVFGYLKKEIQKERATLFEEQIFGGVDAKDPDNVDSILSLLVKDEHLSNLRGEKPLSTDEITQELLVYWVAGHEKSVTSTKRYNIDFENN